jgi:uncharacterized membrane protein YphA (DoxX/SURF4 family)
MDDSIAQVRPRSDRLELASWKTVLSVISAILLAIVFLVSGIWKITDPFNAAARMIQALVPGQLALAAAVGFGIIETFAGLLLVVPRFRRWGAWLSGVLLVAFMIYVGYHYTALTGEDCSCFPWIKRAVGPGFFISDGIMLLLAVFAGIWARPSESVRGAVIALGAISVFAFVLLGVLYGQQTGVEAPDTITVDGKPYSLRLGKHFIYFFDPECSHCYVAAQTMSKFNWAATNVIAVPTVNPQFAQGFLEESGFKAKLSNDAAELKKVFPFGDPPYGVAIENGRQRQSFMQFEGNEPEASLRKLGFIE